MAGPTSISLVGPKLEGYLLCYIVCNCLSCRWEREVGCNSIDWITKLCFRRHHQYKCELFAGRKLTPSSQVPGPKLDGVSISTDWEPDHGGVTRRGVWYIHSLIAYSITISCRIIWVFSFPSLANRRDGIEWNDVPTTWTRLKNKNSILSIKDSIFSMFRCRWWSSPIFNLDYYYVENEDHLII